MRLLRTDDSETEPNPGGKEGKKKKTFDHFGALDVDPVENTRKQQSVSHDGAAQDVQPKQHNNNKEISYGPEWLRIYKKMDKPPFNRRAVSYINPV